MPVYDLVKRGVSMTESEAKVILESEYKFHGECSVFGEALEIAINTLEKQIPKKVDKTEITLSKRKFATELKQLVRQRCAEINHYVSGCNSPFSYLQIADVQESLREIENTLNIGIKE